ncbi:MAG: nitroreductase family protein [Thermoleophilia bacterium]|jgi:hypothetical protein
MLEHPGRVCLHSREKKHPLLRPDSIDSAARQTALDQPICAKAGVVFVWTAIFARSEWKYGDRAYRHCYPDVGYIAAHVSLVTVAEGLAGRPVAAFYDDESNAPP